MLLTASADGTARCYNAVTHQLISRFEGHEGEISKVAYCIFLLRKKVPKLFVIVIS
jgi:WD40 repeat protein